LNTYVIAPSYPTALLSKTCVIARNGCVLFVRRWRVYKFITYLLTRTQSRIRVPHVNRIIQNDSLINWQYKYSARLLYHISEKKCVVKVPTCVARNTYLPTYILIIKLHFHKKTIVSQNHLIIYCVLFIFNNNLYNIIIFWFWEDQGCIYFTIICVFIFHYYFVFHHSAFGTVKILRYSNF